MSITVQNLIDDTNQFFGDTSNESVTQADRFGAISEACTWLIDSTTNDHTLKTARVQYVPTVSHYKLSQLATDVYAVSDLRRAESLQTIPATYKSSREMAEDIANNSYEFSYSIERRDGNGYLVINLPVEASSIKYVEALLDSGSSATGTGDAAGVAITNTTSDYGLGYVGFNVIAAQSVSDYAGAEITCTSFSVLDYMYDGVFVCGSYIPDVTAVSSVSFKIGTDSSNYWVMTTTNTSHGDAFINGENELMFKWNVATKVGSPDAADIKFMAFTLNYSAAQPNMPGVRFGIFSAVMPEWLTFFYSSESIGKSNAGSILGRFTATTDVPYFSGQHDNYRYIIAHKAAEILFRKIHLKKEADEQRVEAEDLKNKKNRIIPSSLVKEERTFKPRGINFTHRKY